MRQLNPQKVFVQYRDIMKPYNPVIGRKYTITHSDATADLFVFIGSHFSEDQVTAMHDDVKIGWEQTDRGLALIGSVLVDGEEAPGNSNIRNSIFLNEMPTALQALRLADRFLFEINPAFDRAPVLIHFISSDPAYDKIYNFGVIGNYK